MWTLFVDSCSFDNVCSLQLSFNQWNVHDAVRGWLRLGPQNGIGTGECPGQLAGQLGQDTAYEPLPRFPQRVNQRVLPTGHTQNEASHTTHTT